MAEDDTASIGHEAPTSHSQGYTASMAPEAVGGDRLDAYRLLELIGEGGFGSVYLAEQTEPVRRRVAVKLLKPGMDSASVTGRFEAERQTLALMDHPNIATVLDAGQSQLGRPYFVMEYVRGLPITKYCDNAKLDIKARVRLARRVCMAVQHAHQKGIIHRDIKPSNVLVAVHDGEPVPKVIDFGIAKAISGAPADADVYTQFHQMLGTPAYMSPEQAGGAVNAVDTRTDVYAIGAMLYELLVGSTPLYSTDLRKLTVSQIHERITSFTPPPLPTRLDDDPERLPKLVERRSTTPGELRAALTGELNWIVQKCLEKDPTRRYATVTALDEDLRRYLELEPVTAGPPSRLYLARKFIRRNRTAVLAGSALLAVLTLGFVGTAVGLVRATQESARLRFTLDFFSRTLAGASSSSPSVAIWSDEPALTLGEALAEAEGMIGQTFEGEPQLESTIRQLVGLAQLRGGEFSAADLQLSRAYTLRRELLGPEHARTLELLLPIAEARSKSGDIAGAVEAAKNAYDRHADALGPNSEVTRAVALWNARWLSSAFRFAEANAYFDRAILEVAGTPDVTDRITLAALIERVNTDVSNGRLARAEMNLRRAEPQLDRLGDQDAALRSLFIRQIGFVLALRGKFDEAIAYLAPQSQADIDADRVRARLYAWAQGLSGSTESASHTFDRLLELERTRPGPPFREIFTRLYMAEYLLEAGDPEQAAYQAEKATEQYDAMGFQNDPDRLWGRALAGMAYVKLGELDRAARAIEEATTMRDLFPEHLLHVPFVIWAEAKLSSMRGEATLAAERATEAAGLAADIFGQEHKLTRDIREWQRTLIDADAAKQSP